MRPIEEAAAELEKRGMTLQNINLIYTDGKVRLHLSSDGTDRIHVTIHQSIPGGNRTTAIKPVTLKVFKEGMLPWLEEEHGIKPVPKEVST